MLWVSIMAEDNAGTAELERGLTEWGFNCSVATNAGEITPESGRAPDIVLINTANHANHQHSRELFRTIKQKTRRPVLIILDKESLESCGSNPDIDDFITKPPNLPELALRINRLAGQKETRPSGEQITSGDLVIDLSRCEVYLEGKVVTLTFKEYETLKFLASNRGRVFNRAALLDKIWGYDYYGGNRTVDVHIRRLRSKLEDRGHIFIETVRNIGYRFREH